jgi:hypothetical protein
VAYDPNHSSVGWYIGSYLLRFVVLGEARNDDPERKFSVWENTVVVQAESLDKAYDKVAAIANEHERHYQNAHGEEVQWVFEGLSELLPIYDKLEDGCEVMWAPYTKKLKKIRRRASTKTELGQRPYRKFEG